MDDTPETGLDKSVRQYLKEIKELILETGLFVVDREKNRAALIELGLTDRQREEEILSLSVENYNSGPHKDIYKPGNY